MIFEHLDMDLLTQEERQSAKAKLLKQKEMYHCTMCNMSVYCCNDHKSQDEMVHATYCSDLKQVFAFEQDPTSFVHVR